MPEDFKRFKKEILDGKDIYQFITECLIEGYDKAISYDDFERIYHRKRKIFKEHIFQFIWYCYYQHPHSNNSTFKIFKSEFPTVAGVLNHFKSRGKSHFAIELQKQEAKLILERVGGRLMKNNILFLTIHDSILLTNKNDLAFTEKIVKEVFEKEYEVAPKMSTEIY